MCAKRKNAEKKKVLVSDEFYSDMTATDMIHALIVRSPFSYGTITSISLSQKTKLPEGYGLLTYKDIPEKNEIDILGTEIPVFCAGEIKHCGQSLALLYGPDREILEELRQDIDIELAKETLQNTESHFTSAYDKLSVSIKDGSPLEQGITSLHSSLASLQSPNEIIAKRKLKIGNPAEIFNNEEKAAYIVEGKWSEKINFSSNKETDGVFCCMKAGNLHIFTSCKWTSQLRQTVTDATGFPKEKIIITRTKKSGAANNNIWQNAIFAAQAALAVIKSGKPVRLSLSRTEQKEFVELPPDIKFSCKTALDKNGLINAMDISIDYDTGAYNPFVSDILDLLCIASTGIYNCKNVSIKAKAFRSHNMPSAPTMQMIESYAFFAIENQIQKISGITGLSPIDIRQMNKAGGLLKSTKPYTFYFGRSSDAINAIAIRSDFKRKYTVSRLAEKKHVEELQSSYAPPQRGLGIACAFEGSGHISQNFEKANISLQVSITEDKKLVVHSIPSSPYIRENWIKIITDNIEIEKKNILFDTGENDDTGKKTQTVCQIPEEFIGNAGIKTILLQKCMDALKRRKWDEAPFSIKKSLYSQRKRIWDSESFSGSPYYNTAFGTCTVELEIDSCTMSEKLNKICVIIDGGKIVNPKAAENAVHRSIQSCLSCLVEGNPLTCSKISVQFMQSEDEPKQIGNIIYSILPAAYTSALSQAIAVSVETLPIQTDTIYKLIKKNDKSTPIESEKEK